VVVKLEILGAGDARVERYQQELGAIKNDFVNLGAQPIQAGEYCVIATAEGDKPVGGMQITNAGQGRIYIIQTVVADEVRGRRLSRAMCEYLEKHLKGFDTIMSMIDADNPSSLKSRADMGFVIGDENMSATRTAKKKIDQAVATKELDEAEAEMVTLHARKSEYAPAGKAEGERERWV